MSDSEPEDETLKAEGRLQVVIQLADDSKVETCFVLKPTTQFKKVFTAYEKEQGVEMGTYVFLYGPHRLSREETPKMAGMEMGRIYKVEANLHQQGGA